jgi:hypothetical protein
MSGIRTVIPQANCASRGVRRRREGRGAIGRKAPVTANRSAVYPYESP